VELRLNGRNLGVATALNRGADWARQKSYQWLLLSDHDTHFDEDAMSTLQAVWRDYPEREKIAVIGCNFVDSNLRSLQYAPDPDESPWSERKTVISSGSLLSLSAFERVGPLRDEFFIDQVDHEYCLRARSKGFRILATGRPVMRHTVGTGKSHGRFGFITLNHPPQRWYYLIRNEMSLVREYVVREPHWAFITVVSRIQRTLAMVLFEEDRFAKLRYAAAGFVDGVLGRFGQVRV
jgi:rhamnosyltransferase